MGIESQYEEYSVGTCSEEVEIYEGRLVVVLVLNSSKRGGR